MRAAYKRYLIASPPPVLVIHLKRFQQLAKAPVMSFSNGFKKLDNYVMFPEVLDLGPFLAPRKEDFGLVDKRKNLAAKVDRLVHARGEKQEKCIYRLYAVVVHIGNIVCRFSIFPRKESLNGSVE
jgi:ubiquitin C-terminal hydrolase